MLLNLEDEPPEVSEEDNNVEEEAEEPFQQPPRQKLRANLYQLPEANNSKISTIESAKFFRPRKIPMSAAD